jgi:hypothetical protein
LKSEAPVCLEKVEMKVSLEVVSGLRKKLSNLERAHKEFMKKKIRIAGLPEVVKLAKQALVKKKYSRLHYLLQSGPVVEALSYVSKL